MSQTDRTAMQGNTGTKGPASDKGRAPSRAQGARNFLRDYDTLLKAMQLDYVDCARYETSGYAEFIGKLYTLNSSMFQSAIFCDRTLTQMMLHYLAWFQDPGVRLLVGEGAAWREVDRIRVQRYGDVLYVTWAAPDAGVRVGERIVGINKMTLDEIRPEVERTLRTTVEPADPEREDWTLVLAFAKFLTVEDEEGVRRTIEVVPGDSAVAGRLRDAIAKRAAEKAGATSAEDTDGDAAGRPEGACGSGGACGCCDAAEGDACGGSEEPLVPVELRCLDGVAVLTVRDLADSDAAGRVVALMPQLEGVERLVVDVRGATGGSQEDAYPLVPLVLSPQTTATSAELFGKPGIFMNYSRHNVDAKLAELAAARKALVTEADGAEPGASELECAGSEHTGSECTGAEHTGAETKRGERRNAEREAVLAEIDALSAELAAKRGAGLALDATDYYPTATFFAPAAGPHAVVVLADRWTADAAEWLVRAACSAGFATVAGRATAGSLDNTCPRVVQLDEDFALVVPTAKYVAATEGHATLGRGIVPDVHIVWTPEHLERDVDLERACELVRRNDGQLRAGRQLTGHLAIKHISNTGCVQNAVE